MALIDRGNQSGLSPRTRRNLDAERLARSGVGPISAYAEEPASNAAENAAATAYLRVRGGTICGARLRRLSKGLSPRTRRNPEQCH